MKYSTPLMRYILQSPKAQKIIDYVAPIYGGSFTGLWMYEVIGRELDDMYSWCIDFGKQTLPQTATWALPYYEQQRGIPTNINIDWDVRVAEVLSRIRTRAPMNPAKVEMLLMGLINDVEAWVDVIEITAQNTFGVEITPGDRQINYRLLRNKLDEVKPAHIIYTMQVKLHVIFDGRVIANAMTFEIRSGASVFGLENFCFNGTYFYDGAKIFTAQFSRGLNVPRFALRAWARAEAALPWGMAIGVAAKGGGYFRLSVLEAGYRATVFCVRTVRFDAAHIFDGTQLFTSQFESGPRLTAFEVRKRNNIRPARRFWMGFGGGHRVRTKLAQLTAGTISTIAPVKFIALGDGGVNGEGSPIAPAIDQAALTHEVCRYAVETPTFPVPTTARFVVVIPEDEQAGVKFSEMALADTDGELVAIKTMFIKQKDDDIEFRLTFDVEF